jgi:small subunit ribosomal protein S14
MAKKSAVERNLKRQRLAAKYAAKRAALKEIARDTEKPVEERFAAQLKLADLPRNSAPTRVRNRCQVSGRPRGYYRKLKMSRVALRQLASHGLDPGHGQVELVGRSQNECE